VKPLFRQLAWSGFAWACGVSAACAQDSPPEGPRVPTIVTYRILNQQSMVPANFTVVFAPGGTAARISFQGNTGYMLVDTARHSLTMVMEQPKMSFQIPTPALFQPYFDWRGNLNLTAEGPGAAAGYACRFWRADSEKGRGRICFSADGVPLRIDAVSNKGERTDVEAISLTRIAYDPAMFTAPADHPALQLNGLQFSPFGG